MSSSSSHPVNFGVCINLFLTFQIFVGKSNKFNTQRWSSKKSNYVGIAWQSIRWYKIWCFPQHAKTEKIVSMVNTRANKQHFLFANCQQDRKCNTIYLHVRNMLLCSQLFSWSIFFYMQGSIGCKKLRWNTITWRVLSTGNSPHGSSKYNYNPKHTLPKFITFKKLVRWFGFNLRSHWFLLCHCHIYLHKSLFLFRLYSLSSFTRFTNADDFHYFFLQRIEIE